MNKLEVQKRVLQNGKPLDLEKFKWDEKAKVFSSVENYLVIDFRNIDDCTFKTESDCTFKTGHKCTFKTGHRCTFDTGRDCTFKTGDDCTFKTESDCTFDTRSGCTFNTGSYCTFNTWSECTFDAGYNCTFNTGHNCTFKTERNCVVVRRDIYQVIELKEGDKIKLNGYRIKGFNVLKTKEEIITLNGVKYKKIEDA